MRNLILSVVKVLLIYAAIIFPVSFVFANTKTFDSVPKANAADFTPTPSITETPSPSTVPAHGLTENNISEPNLIIIPKISLFAPVKISGNSKEGGMEVPPDAKTVGWWKYGTYPGQLGSAVLVGHYKINSGAPGIFYNLNKLSVGDEIIMTLKNGKVLTYIISTLNTYKAEEFPLESFFYSKDARRLNLITCAGKYIKSLDNYSHRLAIYAILK